MAMKKIGGGGVASPLAAYTYPSFDEPHRASPLEVDSPSPVDMQTALRLGMQVEQANSYDAPTWHDLITQLGMGYDGMDN